MKYLINLAKLIIAVVLTTLLFGSLSYFNIISDKLSSIIIMLIFLISLFYISYNMGMQKEKNGYIEGIIFGALILMIFIIVNIILKDIITKFKIIYYLFIFLISVCGSILGINKKTKV